MLLKYGESVSVEKEMRLMLNHLLEYCLVLFV